MRPSLLPPALESHSSNCMIARGPRDAGPLFRGRFGHMDLNFLPSWLERLVSPRARQKAVDLRISDKARQVRRSLAASFEDWPRGPRTMGDLLSWGHKVTGSFDTTQAALNELGELGPE